MEQEIILEKQVEALEKLLQLKQAIIDELEAKVSKLETERLYSQPYTTQPYFPPVSVPSVWAVDTCPDGQPHSYPSVWGGTSAPCCSRCNKPAYYQPQITITSTVGAKGCGATGSNVDGSAPSGALSSVNGPTWATTK